MWPYNKATHTQIHTLNANDFSFNFILIFICFDAANIPFQYFYPKILIAVQSIQRVYVFHFLGVQFKVENINVAGNSLTMRRLRNNQRTILDLKIEQQKANDKKKMEKKME